MPVMIDELLANPSLVNVRAQELSWADLLFEYERALDDDLALLAGLNDDQVHFAPLAGEFSIAEALTHAATADRLFWSWHRLLAAGRRTEINPGELVAGAGTRTDLELTGLRNEIELSRALARAAISSLTEPCDLASTSPHPRFGELNAKGWVYFMCLHHGMHLRQCETVIDTPGFPPGTSKQSLPREVYLQPSDRKTWLEKKPEPGRKERDAGSRRRQAEKKQSGTKPARSRRVSPKNSPRPKKR
jgi:hypothetical protein